jgi:NADH-quinone oxidoreductase subunit L
LYLVGLVTALLTAYYMTRQVVMVFFGEAHWKDRAAEHGAHGDVKPHESPWVMLGPLVVLAVLSTVGGFIQMPFSETTRRLEHWLHPVVEPAEGIGEAHIDGTWADEHIFLLAIIALSVAIIGIIAAYLVYQRKRVKAIEPAILANAWYYDQAVTDFMGGPGRESFEATAWFDANVVDGAVNGAGRTVRGVAGGVRRVQNGYVRASAGVISVGVALLLAWLVIGRGIL